MDRKHYWNSIYPAYFIERTAEADVEGESPQQASTVVAGDKRIAPRDAMWRALDLLDPIAGATWLEIGVGIGRSLPYILGRQPARVIASDLSRTMLDECRKRFADESRIEYVEAEAEALGLPDASVERAVCYGTFDTLFQRRALIEFARVLAPSGQLLITGKHHDYLDDDEAAHAAELGAAAKGHPNYFTDVPAMIALADELGLRVVRRRHFLRRGDLGEEKFVEELPSKFYEFMYVYEKSGTSRDLTVGEISTATSLTRSRRP